MPDTRSAIDRFRVSYEQKSDLIIQQLTVMNRHLGNIQSSLSQMTDIHNDYYDRASDVRKGIYQAGAYGDKDSLSRALIMTALDEDRLQEVIDEINNPTDLPGGQ